MKKNTKIFWIVIAAVFVIRLIYVFATGGLEKMQSSSAPKIAVVNIIGEIYQSDAIIERLEVAFENDQYKGVVLRIDSPGGVVGACQEVYAEIIKNRGKKPIVVSAGSLCASGGYYIASAADSIVVNPGTLIGSIGVIMTIPYFKDLYDKIGVDFRIIKSGDFKDAGSPNRELTKDEEKYFNDLLDNAHAQFIGHIAQGRNMDTAEVAKSSDGRIFTGEQSIELGLADVLGNLNDAIDLCAQMAGLDIKPQTDVIEKDKKFMERLYDQIGAAIPIKNAFKQHGIYYLYGY